MTSRDDQASTRLRLTRQREAVLAVIQHSDKHLTAQEIHDRVRQELPGLAYATVYNALAYLQQAGLIQVVNLGNGPALYDRNTRPHDHLVCRQCGKVFDYSFPDLPGMLDAIARDTNFRIEKADILLTGLCPECQR